MPTRLDYATATPKGPGPWRYVQVVVAMCGLVGLLVGFVCYGIAKGAPGEEPNHKMVAVGEAIMVCSGIGLLLAGRLRI